ncbi:hypothetical protein [Pedobacter namyangjuensis]|uniref:hypothetical protein n=1 Tax=Pedobacter namyangjuensis TaxID=600626 RepID=UPI000DE4C34A|nr:hypothetical protein [Pedobacter namyangjuensis]
MKYLFSLLLLTVFFSDINAQEKGSKIYIENPSKNDNAIKITEELKAKIGEWAYWSVVNTEAQADFKINLTSNTSKGITLTSWGGTSYQLIAKIIDKKGNTTWESNTYKSSPNGTNGFNSGTAVVKKLMRDLKKKFGENK